MILVLFFLALVGASPLAKKDCPADTGGPKYAAPIVAKGFTARVVMSGLTRPRGMVFDTEGNLLVVQNRKEITALRMSNDGGCIKVTGKRTVVNAAMGQGENLNHGIQLTPDGKTLFASTVDKVFSWPYDAKQTKIMSQPVTWVEGMRNLDHTTRTLLMSKKAPGQLLVSRGSGSNIDRQALDINSGISQIRAFDVSGPPKTYTYNKDGKVIGWGLRNSIGMDEHPITGGIWSNENGSDDMKRDGKDIHETSPGEEINFHGYLNGTAYAGQGANYGYPDCAPAWDVENIPRNQKLKVGKQFYIGGSSTAGASDDKCQKEYIPPKLTLPPHWAPIDLRFNAEGTVAYMTSRGSWNKNKPDGYKLFAISFANGEPVHPPDSTTAAIPILSSGDLNACVAQISWLQMIPNPNCYFRPTGLAFDSQGNLFMASEVSGEIFLIGREDGTPVGKVTLERPGKLGVCRALDDESSQSFDDRPQLC